MKVHALSQDGLWAVITAQDYATYAVGIGRSRTAGSPGGALKKTWEAALTTAPGAISIAVGDFVKVRLMDIEHHPNYIPFTLPVSAKDYMPKGKQIPDYPQKCLVCGEENAVVTLFSSTEHKGVCPGPKVKKRGLFA